MAKGKSDGHRRGLLQINFWEHDDPLAPKNGICRQHLEMDFDEEWLRDSIDRLLEDSPTFKKYIEDQFPADEIYEFGFSEGRDGDTMPVSVRDGFLAFHGRLFVPVRKTDKMRCCNYDYGDTGAGKTQIYELVEFLHGPDYCQVTQDPEYIDKFNINSSTAKLRLIAAQDFGHKCPFTAAQVQKMVGGERVAVRDMQSTAGDAGWQVPVWFVSNFEPPWKDEAHALANRLLLWKWKPFSGTADDSYLEKMKKEPRVLLIFLKAYEKLLNHIKNTPSQQWKWQYFDEARKAAVQKTPFVDFLTCKSFQNLQVTYTITPEANATTLKTRLEDIFKKFCESKGITSPEVGVNEMERHLQVASVAMEAKPELRELT